MQAAYKILFVVAMVSEMSIDVLLLPLDRSSVHSFYGVARYNSVTSGHSNKVSLTNVEDQNLNTRSPSQHKKTRSSAAFLKTRRQVLYPSLYHTPLCNMSVQILDPKSYFNTQDGFIPNQYKRILCSGQVGPGAQYPSCQGNLDCVTFNEDLYFIRKPSYDCSTWYEDVIYDVPVGCSCMKPTY